MTPVEWFAEVGSALQLICKKPYRSEPLMPEELDKLSEAVLMLCHREKERINGHTTNYAA